MKQDKEEDDAQQELKKEESLLNDIKMVLQKLKTTSAQDDLLDTHNIWIIKPASMSRGRGIDFFNDLASILKYVIGTRVEWIVQKYIERPLIIEKLKFDLR